MAAARKIAEPAGLSSALAADAVEALILNSDTTGAKAAIDKLSGLLGQAKDKEKEYLLTCLATAQAKMGDFGSAKADALAIKDKESRFACLSSIAEIQVELKDLPGALATLDSLPSVLEYLRHPGDKARNLAGIARIRAGAGDKSGAASLIVNAFRSASSERDPIIKVWAMTSVANAQIAADDNQGATRSIGEAYEASHKHQNDLRSSLLSCVAQSQAKMGDIDGAKSTMDEMLGQYGGNYKQRATVEVARAFVRRGDVSEARAVVGGINNKEMQAVAILGILDELIRMRGTVQPGIKQ